jgi:hypothetical protein
VTLGAFTVITRRDPWINSVHVVGGALVLTMSLVITLRAWRAKFAVDTVRLKPDTTGEKEEGVAAHADIGSVRLQPDSRGRA